MNPAHFPLKGPYNSVNRSQRKAINELVKKIESGVYQLTDNDCICGSKEDILLADKDRYRIDIDTFLCEECGIIRVSPILDDNSLNLFYKNDYRRIYSSPREDLEKHHENQIKHGEEILSFLDDIIHLPKDAIIYDIGCASGGTLVPFIRKGYFTSGLEINNEYMQYGIIQGIDIQSNESNFYKTMQNADLIIMSHVLEHLSKPQQILKKIRENLSDDGLLYVEVPGVLDTHNQYNHFMFALQQAHIWYFSRDTLENVLNSCGFSLIKGDEKIKAVFKKSVIKNLKTQKEHSAKIKEYLIEKYLKYGIDS